MILWVLVLPKIVGHEQVKSCKDHVDGSITSPTLDLVLSWKRIGIGLRGYEGCASAAFELVDQRRCSSPSRDLIRFAKESNNLSTAFSPHPLLGGLGIASFDSRVEVARLTCVAKHRNPRHQENEPIKAPIAPPGRAGCLLGETATTTEN